MFVTGAHQSLQTIITITSQLPSPHKASRRPLCTQKYAPDSKFLLKALAPVPNKKTSISKIDDISSTLTSNYPRLPVLRDQLRLVGVPRPVRRAPASSAEPRPDSGRCPLHPGDGGGQQGGAAPLHHLKGCLICLGNRRGGSFESSQN